MVLPQQFVAPHLFYHCFLLSLLLVLRNVNLLFNFPAATPTFKLFLAEFLPLNEAEGWEKPKPTLLPVLMTLRQGLCQVSPSPLAVPYASASGLFPSAVFRNWSLLPKTNEKLV